MDYTINYADASNRQEIIQIYSLYYYIVNGSTYSFDIGHLIIALLTYMVEEGRVNGRTIKGYALKAFMNEYFMGIQHTAPGLLEDVTETLITRLQGAKANGEPIIFKYYDHESHNLKSAKIAYMDYNLRDDGFQITDKGLEFLISSKEIPQESKLTVALYLFKLQLEKKKYTAALHTIKNINLETLRQLDLKNEILAMSRYNRKEAGRLYKKYWGDFYALRQEEQTHYEDATNQIRQFKDPSYLEENQIQLTIEESTVLKTIERELSKSTALQAVYTNEMSKMSGEMLEMDQALMMSVFLTLFNFKEHFDGITKNEVPMEAFLRTLQPLFLPKKGKTFGIHNAIVPQKVLRAPKIMTVEEISMRTQKFIKVDQLYLQRMEQNYFTFFQLLMFYLTKISQTIENLQDFVAFVGENKGETALESIDFLSFLTSLSGVMEGAGENTQIIPLNESIVQKEIEMEGFQPAQLFSYFWIQRMAMPYNAELHVATEPEKKIEIMGAENRFIGNMKITFVEKGSRNHV